MKAKKENKLSNSPTPGLDDIMSDIKPEKVANKDNYIDQSSTIPSTVKKDISGGISNSLVMSSIPQSLKLHNIVSR